MVPTSKSCTPAITRCFNELWPWRRIGSGIRLGFRYDWSIALEFNLIRSTKSRESTSVGLIACQSSFQKSTTCWFKSSRSSIRSQSNARLKSIRSSLTKCYCFLSQSSVWVECISRRTTPSPKPERPLLILIGSARFKSIVYRYSLNPLARSHA